MGIWAFLHCLDLLVSVFPPKMARALERSLTLRLCTYPHWQIICAGCRRRFLLVFRRAVGTCRFCSRLRRYWEGRLKRLLASQRSEAAAFWLSVRTSMRVVVTATCLSATYS